MSAGGQNLNRLTHHCAAHAQLLTKALLRRHTIARLQISPINIIDNLSSYGLVARPIHVTLFFRGKCHVPLPPHLLRLSTLSIQMTHNEYDLYVAQHYLYFHTTCLHTLHYHFSICSALILTYEFICDKSSVFTHTMSITHLYLDKISI